MLKKVHMTLHSVQYEPPEEPLIPAATPPKAPPPVRMVQNLVARYRETDDEISLSYDEPDESAEGRVQVQLFFAKSAPETVTLARSGLQRYVLTFCQGSRCSSEYSVAGMGMEITAVTRSLKNTILSDGKLHIEYHLELQGCDNGKRIVDITISPFADTIKEY